MRKLLMTFLTMLILMTAALADDDALYPARGDNGLYGYINARAEWVIAPQFDGVGTFRGDYAIAIRYPEGFVNDPDDPFDEEEVACEGIIDRTGHFVLEPIARYIDAGYDGRYYGGKDTGIWVICTDESDGFFDIPSGYYSGQGVNPWHWISDSQLIPVEGGYMDRTTGRMVIPGDFDWCDPASFHDGIVSTSYVDMDGNPIKYFMMDERGNVIHLPDGVSSTYQGYYSCGRMLVVDENDCYGYADGAGNIVIPMQYPAAGDFNEGLAAVQFPEGDHGYIDVNGHAVVRGFTRSFTFYCGYGEVWLSGTSYDDCVIGWVDREGNIVPFMDSDRFYPISPDRMWMHTEADYSSPLHLLDGQGNILTAEPVYLMEFESWSFDEGLQAACNAERKWGYIDLNGQVVIPFIYSAAYAFDGELARVRLGDRVGYIDRAGNEIFMWDDPIK